MGSIASVLQWHCEKCALINPTERTKCGRCGTPRVEKSLGGTKTLSNQIVPRQALDQISNQEVPHCDSDSDSSPRVIEFSTSTLLSSTENTTKTSDKIALGASCGDGGEAVVPAGARVPTKAEPEESLASTSDEEDAAAVTSCKAVVLPPQLLGSLSQRGEFATPLVVLAVSAAERERRALLRGVRSSETRRGAAEAAAATQCGVLRALVHLARDSRPRVRLAGRRERRPRPDGLISGRHPSHPEPFFTLGSNHVG
ncbi:hypothetical protein B566_EDAN015390 [Ephemera danica]|nr:hypothetical protein B566_EDAN015390 [Ephemera danica]